MANEIPDMLMSYAAFQQWIEGRLSGLSGHDKGDPWQLFSKELLPLTDYGKSFYKFRDNPRKTRDHGWDIQGMGVDENAHTTLYVQSKFKMPSQNDLDSVISNFTPLAGVPEGQLPLGGMIVDRQDIFFAITTISDLQTSIVPNYLRSGKPSVMYFKQWLLEKRIEIIDGPVIWKLFRDWFVKSFGSTQAQTLNFVGSYAKFENVYLGVIAASEVRRIYHETGNAIFFENVRDFTGQTDVNEKIAETIQKEPYNFLALNNGIVFSASDVQELDTSTLQLDRASIVNGCQTTTTIVQTNPSNQQEFYLQVKIVKIDEEPTSWKVTHAANYQNEINRIDLDLARFIRPQVVKKQSWWAGIPLNDSNDVWNIIEVFNRQKVTWQNVRIMFIGLFSRDPGNMFDVNFAAVNGDLLSAFLENERLKQQLFDVVFALHEASERGARQASEWLDSDSEMREIFARLLGDTRAPYMQYLTILATCALVDINIAERQEPTSKEFERMKNLIQQFQMTLETEINELDYAYFVALEKVANDVLVTVDSGDKVAISKKMHSRITKRDKFTNLFLQVKLGIQAARRGRDLYR
jgi:hypothetical protein